MLFYNLHVLWFHLYIQISAHGGSRRQVQSVTVSLQIVTMHSLFVTGGTKTWKNPPTKEKYVMCYQICNEYPAIIFIVDSAAEEYNAFFYSLVSSVSEHLIVQNFDGGVDVFDSSSYTVKIYPIKSFKSITTFSGAWWKTVTICQIFLSNIWRISIRPYFPHQNLHYMVAQIFASYLANGVLVAV